VGAYQEILGDLHNLFGDTNAVHVSLDEQRRGGPRTVIRATPCAKCSITCSSKPRALLEQFRTDVETAVREGRIGYEESGSLLRFYEEGLNGYTYLEQ
jgi:arginine decarboxylase